MTGGSGNSMLCVRVCACVRSCVCVGGGGVRVCICICVSRMCVYRSD